MEINEKLVDDFLLQLEQKEKEAKEKGLEIAKKYGYELVYSFVVYVPKYPNSFPDILRENEGFHFGFLKPIESSIFRKILNLSIDNKTRINAISDIYRDIIIKEDSSKCLWDENSKNVYPSQQGLGQFLKIVSQLNGDLLEEEIKKKLSS